MVVQDDARQDDSGSYAESYNALRPNALDSADRPRKFLSLRWKLTLPLLVVVAALAMLATYLITDSVARGLRDAQANQLIGGARSVSERAASLGEAQRREAERVAFTQNVPELVVARNSLTLKDMIQPLAAAANLDYVIVGGATGQEVVGLQASGGSYKASADALLDKLGFTQAVLSVLQPGGTGIIHIIDSKTNKDDYAFFTAVPIHQGKQIVGIAVVGVTLDKAIQSLQSGSSVPLTIYGPQGELLRTSFASDDATQKALVIDPDANQMALAGDNRVPVRNLQIGQTVYAAAYVPLIADSTLLGVIGIFQQNNVWYATDASRQMLSVVFGFLTAAVVLIVFGGASLALNRLGRVTHTAKALAWGNPYARTDMRPGDEIGELGHALDRYAQRTQKRQDFLETSLRNQRRETTRLIAVLASIPDGIIVQDLDGRVILMNDSALGLLGSQRVFRSSPLNELTAIVTDQLGPALAPGVYSLGDPQRVPLDGKILHAQAAAVMTVTDKRIGTVIVLRDITEDVRREQAREAALARLKDEIQKPVGEQPLKGSPEQALQDFIREINRNSIALQRMISEIRDLSTTDAKSLKSGQQALPAETLMWNVAREWQAVAAASHIELHVLILRRGLLVLGEERRLRWAIGNLVDNAVKYTPPRGHITLLLRATDDEQYAQFSIKDSGTGISANELPHVFTRFFRGKPMLPNGQPIQTPGTGQGLFIAKRVIEAHGGTIELTSAIGHGTEVIFTLPLTANITLNLNDQAVPTQAENLTADLPSESAEALPPDENS